MYKVFDFRCKECNRVEEHLVKDGDTPWCQVCSCDMVKLIAAPHLDYNAFWLQDMSSGDKYDKMRRQHQRLQKGSKERNGTYSVGGQTGRWDKPAEDFV